MEKKTAVIIACLILSLVLFTACGGEKQSTSEQKTSLLAETMDLTAEQEAAMMEVFSACAIGEITSAKVVQSGAERTSYHLKDEETSHYLEPIVVYINNATKAVETIYYADQDILIDGSPVSLVTLYYVSTQQRETIQLVVQNALTQVLKHPDSAKYKHLKDWQIGVIDGQIVAQSDVTSLNDFNVEETLKFQAIFDQLTAELKSFIVDGTEYIK